MSLKFCPKYKLTCRLFDHSLPSSSLHACKTYSLKVCVGYFYRNLPLWLIDDRYQEMVLSSRCLVFMNGRVFFYCRAAVWREDLMAESEEISPAVKSSTGGSLASPEPLKRLGDHVYIYSSRDLTYLGDISNAFDGIKRAISPFLNGSGFLRGLPVAAFDWGLLWGAFYGAPLRRRPGFPSWSWMGHVGRVIMAHGSSGDRTQKWLREKTWIDWHFADNEDTKPVYRSHVVEEEGADTTNAVQPGYQMAAPHTGDFCPEYGREQPGNLFGREGKYLPDLGIHLCSNLRPAGIKSAPHGSLDFMTFSCKYYLSQPLTPNARETYTSSCFILRDSQQETCGVCHDDHNLFGSGWAFEGQTCEVILLSYAAAWSRDRAVYRFAHLEIPDKYRSRGIEEDVDDGVVVLDDEGDMQWESWDMFNVMLVRPYPENSDIYERIAIGVLHQRAVENSLQGVCFKRIILY